jgi:hypothetical protein
VFSSPADFREEYRRATPPRRGVSQASSQFCPRVLDVLAESLSWNTQLGRWLLIGSEAFTPTDGAFFLSTSTDLVNWTAPRVFHSADSSLPTRAATPIRRHMRLSSTRRARSATSASPGGRAGSTTRS